MEFKRKYLIGIIYILYAIVKISVGVCLFTLPVEKIATIPIAKIFVKEAADKTLAGRFYEYMLFLFGIFSLFEGLSLLELLPQHIINYFESKYIEYIVFILIGTCLVLFYSLVLYTNIPISKNFADYDHYKLLGFYTGISFLIMPILWELLAYFVPVFNNLPFETKSAIIIGSVILLSIIAELIYTYLHKHNESITQVVSQQQGVQIAVAVKNEIIPTNVSPATKKN
jgi:hypothetical protein